MKKILTSLSVLTLVLFAACAKKNTASKAAEMPTTYAGDVVPLIQAKCSPCHLPTQGGNKANFETFESAKKYGSAMLDRIMLNPGDRGFMPFKHKEKLTAEEIAVVKKWVDTGLTEK
ncbi:MAG: hypothetical protein WBP16_12165 [Ferruginibacter sp.]